MLVQNSIQLIGHLGKDAEIFHTGEKSLGVNFTLATQGKYIKNQEQETEWHDITYFGTPAQIELLTKGTHISIQGSLEYNIYQKGDIKIKQAVINASAFLLLDKKQ